MAARQQGAGTAFYGANLALSQLIQQPMPGMAQQGMPQQYAQPMQQQAMAQGGYQQPMQQQAMAQAPAAGGTMVCPFCQATTAIGAAGICTFCGSKIV